MAKKKAESEEKGGKGGCLIPIVILIVLLLIGGGGSKDRDSSSKSNKATAKPTATATKTPKPTATKTPKPKATATKAPVATKETSKEPVDKETVKEKIIDRLSEHYSYVNVEIIDDGFSISISTDNIGQAAYYAQTLQSEELLKEWDIMCDSLAANCKEIQEFIENEGLDIETVMLFLANDQDHSLALVSVINGYIVQNSVTRK